MHTVTLPDGTESKPFVCTHITRKGDGNNAGQLPTTREILYYAATTIHADGAGLHKRPEGVSYTNKYIPTLVAATHPTQTHTVTLLGHDITITLTATSYTWSWGDGTPDLTATSPGMPWQEGMDPNTDPALIRHYYKAPNGWKSFLDGPYPYATRTITLTTTWAGTATNPFTGDTQTINGLVTTTETTGPFPPRSTHRQQHRHRRRKTRPLKRRAGTNLRHHHGHRARAHEGEAEQVARRETLVKRHG